MNTVQFERYSFLGFHNRKVKYLKGYDDAIKLHNIQDIGCEIQQTIFPYIYEFLKIFASIIQWNIVFNLA